MRTGLVASNAAVARCLARAVRLAKPFAATPLAIWRGIVHAAHRIHAVDRHAAGGRPASPVRPPGRLTRSLSPDSSVLLHRAIDLRRLPSSPSNSDGQKANDTAKPFACEENSGTTIRPTRQVLRRRRLVDHAQPKGHLPRAPGRAGVAYLGFSEFGYSLRVRGLLGAGSRSALPLRFSVIFEYGGLIP